MSGSFSDAVMFPARLHFFFSLSGKNESFGAVTIGFGMV